MNGQAQFVDSNTESQNSIVGHLLFISSGALLVCTHIWGMSKIDFLFNIMGVIFAFTIIVTTIVVHFLYSKKRIVFKTGIAIILIIPIAVSYVLTYSIHYPSLLAFFEPNNLWLILYLGVGDPFSVIGSIILLYYKPVVFILIGIGCYYYAFSVGKKIEHAISKKNLYILYVFLGLLFYFVALYQIVIPLYNSKLEIIEKKIEKPYIERQLMETKDQVVEYVVSFEKEIVNNSGLTLYTTIDFLPQMKNAGYVVSNTIVVAIDDGHTSTLYTEFDKINGHSHVDRVLLTRPGASIQSNDGRWLEKDSALYRLSENSYIIRVLPHTKITLKQADARFFRQLESWEKEPWHTYTNDQYHFTVNWPSSFFIRATSSPQKEGEPIFILQAENTRSRMYEPIYKFLIAVFSGKQKEFTNPVKTDVLNIGDKKYPISFFPYGYNCKPISDFPADNDYAVYKQYIETTWNCTGFAMVDISGDRYAYSLVVTSVGINGEGNISLDTLQQKLLESFKIEP